MLEDNLHCAEVFEGDRDQQFRLMPSNRGWSDRQRLSGGISIGPNQPTGAEFRPSEVANHHHRYPDNSGSLQDLQDRLPRRPLRLSIIIAAIFADQAGSVAVVRCIRELSALATQSRDELTPICGRVGSREKSGPSYAKLDQLRLADSLDLIRIGQSALFQRLSPPRSGICCPRTDPISHLPPMGSVPLPILFQ